MAFGDPPPCDQCRERSVVRIVTIVFDGPSPPDQFLCRVHAPLNEAPVAGDFPRRDRDQQSRRAHPGAASRASRSYPPDIPPIEEGSAPLPVGGIDPVALGTSAFVTPNFPTPEPG